MFQKKNFLFYLLLTIFSLNILKAKELNIAIASNLNYAIKDIQKEFEEKFPHAKIRIIIGSSGKLSAQILHGAPYGIFLSANMKYPQILFEKNIAITKPKVYAEGTLSYLSVKKIDFSKGTKLLNSKEIKKIAIANPKTAPYGKATVDALKKAGIYDDIKSKFVYAENISQALTYSIKAADIGIVASSSLYNPMMKRYKRNINYFDLDTSLYTPIKQGIVLLKFAKEDKEYKAFYDFIFSDKAKEIFIKYGYKIK